jgi:hypothetical protein
MSRNIFVLMYHLHKLLDLIKKLAYTGSGEHFPWFRVEFV